jgi:hypothetical protein
MEVTAVSRLTESGGVGKAPRHRSQMTDNAGATNDHRALNYLAMLYPGIYAKTAEEFARNFR